MTKKPKAAGGLIILVLLGILLAVFIATTTGSSVETRKYSEIIGYFEKGQVKEFTLSLKNGTMELKLDDGTLGKSPEVPQASSASGATQDQMLTMQQAVSGRALQADPNKVVYALPYIELFLRDLNTYIDVRAKANPDAPLVYDILPAPQTSVFMSMLPMILLMIGAMAVFYFFMYSQSGGRGAMSVGRAKVKNEADSGRKATFKDVAGADEEKEELQEIVEFLKNPGRFNTLGARIPHGVLLVGPPGTGKTLLARACAGEAGVPFYSISGSDFVEMYVGVGASRVRDLFEKGKKTAPCIIFIDEIDAVGRQRGAGLGGGHDEREQTLNQLLVEMDGFGANEGVIVVAATNRADILDKALLRPGRFDRQVYVGLPDVKGREEILQVHTRNKPLGPDVVLKTIAKSTVGFTGADLENLVNEAALLAARKGRKAITEIDIEEASIKVIAGPEKKSRVVSDKEKRLTAYHEAGHAITHHICESADPVHQISIIPRGMAGGYTMSLPEDDKSFITKHQMEDQIVTLLGGRVAEKLVLDDISTGASNDLERATAVARAMVTRYGFSERLGPVVYGTDQNETFLGRDFATGRNYSEAVASEIDAEMREMLDEGFERAKTILEDHMQQLHLVAAMLIEREKLSGEEFETLMNGGTLPDVEASVVPAAAEKAEENAVKPITAEVASEQVGEHSASTGAEQPTDDSNSTRE